MIIADKGLKGNYHSLFKGTIPESQILAAGILVEIYLSILPFCSQYIFSLLMFVVNNKDLFKMNSDVHTFNTRSNCDLHFPVVNLTVCQKGVRCSGIKLYNHLPSTLSALWRNTIVINKNFEI
jgi:hypothetical protein